ncbi:TonB-dependent siderophore receptor [Porphyromonas sp.]|uniref:TonB-dependent receptor plug domain-containing protein n=1 Tax=Porphyromonas sp. TaxID=1924944 RepID=UPI0026DCE000|nr:TonB-dependent receptor [Porphyromonas sp.]MDO4771782.1 TonB-dependent receptor [Porphyromonas sp.]
MKIHIIAAILIGAFVYCISAQAQTPSKSLFDDDTRHALDEFVVTATRTLKKISDSPVMTQVITGKQIAERGITDFKTLLMQEVPGLTFNEVGFGTSINMQGLDAKHILFLVDGERLAGETGNNIDYQRINLDNIERIEIVQGAGSALYGTQAMGGVINIITKKPKGRFRVSLNTKWAPLYQNNFPRLEADDKYELFKRNADAPNFNGSLTASYAHKKWSTQTTFTRRSADAFSLYDTEGLTKYFKEYDVTLTMPVKSVPTNVSGFGLNSLRQAFTFTPDERLSFSATGTLYEMSKYDLNHDNIYEYNTDLSGTLSGAYRLSNGGEIKVSFFADQYNRYQKFELIEGRKDLVYKHRMIQPRLSYIQRLGESHELNVGAEYFDEMLYTDKFTNDSYTSRSQHSSALYIQDDWQITSRIGLVTGLRADYHSTYGFNLAPKLSAIYKMIPVTFRLNYGAGYRSPGIKELYMNWDHFGMFMIYGNTDLKPERNHYLSLSSEYVSKRFYAILSGYINAFSNKIEGIWAKDQKERHYRNLQSVELMGLQAQVRFNPFVEGLQLHASANYLHPGEVNGAQLNSQSRFSGTFRAEYQKAWKKHGLNVNLTASYIGKKEFDVQEDLLLQDRLVKASYTTTIPAYTLWYLALSYRYDRFGRLTFGLDNIFDYHAAIHSFNSYTGIGRNWFVALNLEI